MIRFKNRIDFIALVSILTFTYGDFAIAQSPDSTNLIQANRPPESIAEDLVVGNTFTKSVSTISTDNHSPLPETDSLILRTIAGESEKLLSKEGTESSIKLVLLLGALSLAPAILLMTTCYVRIIVVLTLLRQAFGGQQLPPNQVLTALSLFLTLLVMSPVWNEVKTEAIDPYSTNESITWEEAWNRGIVPVKRFMTRQIEIAKNTNSIAVFYRYSNPSGANYPPPTIDEVPITVLLPAFIISELKVAFLIGFQIFLPFIVLDFVVSTVTVSMGMLMLPPTMISFPLKLILFVMVDGWNLVVGMLLQSFGPLI